MKSMNSQIADVSNAYKRALLVYAVLFGPTQELIVFHMKLMDIIDILAALCDDDGQEQKMAHDELATSTQLLVRKTAGHVEKLIVAEINKYGGQAPRERDIHLQYVTRLRQLDEIQLGCSQYVGLVIRAMNSALQQISKDRTTKYLDLEKLTMEDLKK